MRTKQLESIIEAILFTMGDSVEVSKIASAIEQDVPTTEKLKERMQQIRQPWSVSVPAQAAGIEALTEREEQRVQKIRNKIVEEKMRMEKKMREFGIRFIPTKANFFLLYSEIPLFDRLLEQGILVRDCGNYRGLSKGWYRIAVRTKEENDVLLRAFETILSKQ